MNNHKLKQSIINKIYKKIAALTGGSDYNIERDDLRKRYGGSHRYNLRISVGSYSNSKNLDLEQLRHTLIADFMIEGWNFELPDVLLTSKTEKEWIVFEKDGRKLYLHFEKVFGETKHSKRFNIYPLVISKEHPYGG